jgi:quercetin dioxygenase-like cupin family protein
MIPRLAAALLLAMAGVSVAQEPGKGTTVTPVLDNSTVSVSRVTLAPGAREQTHTHPHPILLVVLSRSDVEMHHGSAHTKGPRAAGDVEFVGAGVPHARANVGAAPLDELVLALKPDRPHGGTTPPPQPLPGVTRTLLLDNSDVTVTRLDFEAGAREPVHTHPYDLLVVPTTPARMDLQLGMSKEVRGYAAGETIFIPRSVPHAAANVGTSSFRVLGIAVK